MKPLLYKILLGFSCTFLLTNCSWQNYLYITNMTGDEVTVTYQITNANESGFVFGANPEMYQSANSGEPDWQVRKTVTDLDTSQNGIQITIPEMSSLIISTLSNDTYKGSNRKTEGGQVFNLVELEIISRDRKLTVNRANFDHHFDAPDGESRLVIH